MEAHVGETPDAAYRLQVQVDRWHELVARQQDLALRLRGLVMEQRELTDLWEASGATDLVHVGREAVQSIQAVSGRLLGLERTAVDMIIAAIDDMTRRMDPN
jgi:hypothetical protein